VLVKSHVVITKSVSDLENGVISKSRNMSDGPYEFKKNFKFLKLVTANKSILQEEVMPEYSRVSIRWLTSITCGVMPIMCSE